MRAGPEVCTWSSTTPPSCSCTTPLTPSWRVLWEGRRFYIDKLMFFDGGGGERGGRGDFWEYQKYFAFKVSCQFQGGSRETLFRKARALDGKEDDSEPLPEPRWQLFHIRFYQLENFSNPFRVLRQRTNKWSNAVCQVNWCGYMPVWIFVCVSLKNKCDPILEKHNEEWNAAGVPWRRFPRPVVLWSWI